MNREERVRGQGKSKINFRFCYQCGCTEAVMAVSTFVKKTKWVLAMPSQKGWEEGILIEMTERHLLQERGVGEERNLGLILWNPALEHKTAEQVSE